MIAGDYKWQFLWETNAAWQHFDCHLSKIIHKVYKIPFLLQRHWVKHICEAFVHKEVFLSEKVKQDVT